MRNPTAQRELCAILTLEDLWGCRRQRTGSGFALTDICRGTMIAVKGYTEENILAHLRPPKAPEKLI